MPSSADMEEIKKKRTVKKLSLSSIIFLGFGVLFILGGIVFWLILALVLKQGIENIESDSYSIFYYLSIVAVTIGLGLITVSFSIRGLQDRKTDKSEELKTNTNRVLKSYNVITGSSDALFVREVLEDFSKEWSLDTIEASFVDDPDSYYDKFYDLLTTPHPVSSSSGNKNSPTKDFLDSLLDICKDGEAYHQNKPATDDEYIIHFLKTCANLLKQFEDICYEYCNDRVSKKLFELDILPGIKKYLLRGYLAVRYYNLDSELTYVRLSLLKEKNKVNMLLEEV